MDPSERFSEAVINAITEVSDYEPVGSPGDDGQVLPPLYRSVDPDALDALLGGTPAEGSEVVRLSFDYEEFAVTVQASGTVQVQER